MDKKDSGCTLLSESLQAKCSFIYIVFYITLERYLMTICANAKLLMEGGKGEGSKSLNKEIKSFSAPPTVTDGDLIFTNFGKSYLSHL